jgi:hypothetical protein
VSVRHSPFGLDAVPSDWMNADFDDSAWPAAVTKGGDSSGDSSRSSSSSESSDSSDNSGKGKTRPRGLWISVGKKSAKGNLYCRGHGKHDDGHVFSMQLIYELTQKFGRNDSQIRT